MKFTEHEGGMSFKLDTIEQTLSVYLQWEGIIGYDHMILNMKGWSEDDIDDVLSEEGIYGFSREIYTILEGKSAFCAGMDTDDFLNVCREQGIDVSGEKPDIFVATEESKSSTESVSSSKPQKGDRVVVSYYQHPNNGLKGVVTSKVGNLCWVKTDEYGTLTFIDTFLDKIDESSSTEQMHAGPIDYIKNDLSRAKIKYSFDDGDTFSFDNYDDMRQAEEIICQVVGENYNKSNNSISINLEETADESFEDENDYKGAWAYEVYRDSDGELLATDGGLKSREVAVKYAEEAAQSYEEQGYGECSYSVFKDTNSTPVWNRKKTIYESSEDDFNKKVLQDALANKNKSIKEYNIGSNKQVSQTGDTRTLNRLRSLAKKLEASSERGFRYVIEDGWEDYGAGMKWTSIVAVEPNGSSHWVISPGEWVTLANGDDDSIIDVVQASIQSDEFFQDRKEKEPMNKRIITSAKEDLEDYDVLDRYRFNGDYLERTKYLIFDISDRGALPEFIKELENWEDITWLFEDEDDPGESLNRFSNYEPGGKVFDINGTHFYVTADGSDVYTEDDDPEETFRIMMEDDSMRSFLERNGLIVELDEDQIRDNLGLDHIEDEEDDDDGEIDDYSAEEGIGDGKDYVVKLKCNDNPFHTVKFISESDDIDKIIARAKNYYGYNYVTYADDRANNWVIDEILENGKVRGVPLEYTDDFENAFDD